MAGPAGQPSAMFSIMEMVVIAALALLAVKVVGPMLPISTA